VRALRGGIGLGLLVLTGAGAEARICDYRPSELLRSDLAATAASSARDAAGRILETTAQITLRDVATGASLLGRGAGTVGQIGTASANLAAGVATAPGVALAGGAAVLGAGAWEGLCFFRDERITDPDVILAIMTAVAAFADPAHFRVEGTDATDAMVVLGDGAGGRAEFGVRRLRIVNGVLLHREWGRDTELGNKLSAEFFGTFWLVFGGCGSAVLAAGYPELGIGFVGVSLAFGLTVLTMAYAVGHISGGHFNPAVSLGLAIGGRFAWGELAPYWGAQVAGRHSSPRVLLYLIASGAPGWTAGRLRLERLRRPLARRLRPDVALLIEVVLTAAFLIIILGATSPGRPPVSRRSPSASA
jgi:hypothetical protein